MLALLLVAVIAGPVATDAAEDAPDHAAALHREAMALNQKGQFSAAQPLLQRSIALLERQLGPDDPRLADTLSDLADTVSAQGHYRDAEPLYRRVLSIRERAAGPDRLDLGASLNALAGLYKLEGHYAEAEDLFRRALQIVEAAPNPPGPVLVTILNNLALVYQNQARYDEAEPLYRRAIAESSKTPETETLLGAVVLNNLAGLYKEQRRFAEAEPLYRRVLERRERDAPPLDLAASLNNLASLYDAAGRYRDAEPLYRRALELREATLDPEHPDIAQSLNNLAGIHWAEGEYDKTEPLLTRALDIRQRTVGADHPDTATALNNLAALYWNERKYDDALAMSRRTIAAIEAHLAAASGRNSDAAFAEYRKARAYVANYVGIAYGAAQKQPERQAELAADTLRVVQLAGELTTAQAVLSMAARLAAGDDALAVAIRQRQDLALRRQVLDADIVKAALRPMPERTARLAAIGTELSETTLAAQALDGEIQANFPGYAELASPKPAAATAVQSLLEPDEALLVYFTTPKDTWFWVVRRKAIALFRADWNAHALAREVNALRSALTPSLGPYPASRAFEVYDKIVAPALPLVSGAHRLIIVPDGPLQSLPFSILVTRRPEHDPGSLSDYRSVAWFARDYAVSVLPAVATLRALRQTGTRTAAEEPFLGIGDPVMTGAFDARSGTALAGVERGFEGVLKLPPLPESADELRAIARLVGGSEDNLLLGERATKPLLHHLPLDRYRIIQFATHALLAGEVKGLAEPALVMTPPQRRIGENDALLTASEIATLKLNADWVVLSACNTAATDTAPEAGGWSALAKAFFYAGARSMLVSHWPVWSKAAVALTTGTFAALAKDPSIGRAEALRRGEIAMLDPAAPPEFAHPMAWAPFELAGEGGVAR